MILGLLSGACVCLASAQVKARRRKRAANTHLATALAGGLRSGVLEFESAAPVEGAHLGWVPQEDDEEEEPRCKALVLRSSMYRSRYELLAYAPPEEEPLRVRVSYLGGGPNPESPISNEDLLRGIPHEFLHPEGSEGQSKREAPSLERIALPPIVDSDNPREGIEQANAA